MATDKISGPGTDGLYRKLVELASDGFWLLDKKFLTVYVSPALEKLLGYTKEEMSGRSWYDFADPAWVARAKELERRREQGIKEPHEFLFIRKDGSKVLTRIATTPLYDAAGNFDGAIGVLSDITGRKEAVALAAESRRVQNLMEVSPAGIVYVDAAGAVTYANHRAEELLGLSRSELAGRAYNAPAWRSTKPDGTPFPGEEEPFVRVRQTKRPVVNVEQVIEWPNGRRITLSINGAPLLSDSGEFLGMAASLDDITERRLTEEKLRESEARFQQLFQTMEEGFATHEIICDGEGRPVDYRFLDMNPAFERLTGLKKRDIVGRTVLEVMPATEKIWIENYGRVALGGEPMHFESGSVSLGKVYEVSAFSPGKGRFAVSFYDITERKRAEQEKEELNAALVEKNKDIENFIYLTTHDLRAPLVNIHGFSLNLASDFKKLQDILAPVPMPEEIKSQALEIVAESGREALGFISESALKMNQMLEALLKVARLGRLEMSAETVDMNAALKNVLASLAFQLGQAGGEVKAGLLPPCKADAGVISQLFVNLLDNAVKYRDLGRKLEITVRGEMKDARTAVYTVSDNGQGINAADLDKIGEIFFRGRMKEPAAEKGEGIGLAMVKRMAERSGGRLLIRSKEGEGAQFSVELPAP